MCDIAYAVNGVVGEIRDANTRAYLQVLPFEFKLKEPTSDAVKFGIYFIILVLLSSAIYRLKYKVSNFARKTGDYSNLSAVDLQLVSLTYQLCKENYTAEEFSMLKLEPSKNVGFLT